jgi:hypothetical protein
MSPLRRWTSRGLFWSWLAYWAVLIVVKLGPAIAAIWRATHAPAGQGTVSANFSNGVLSVVITQAGRTLWSGSNHLLALAAWIAGPPLLLWLIWATQRTRAQSPDRVSS